MYTQSGRSMVEMLGVLAIIGVLSVGAIAGYSKAMEKYKLNKAATQISSIATNILTTFVNEKDYSALGTNPDTGAATAIKLKLIPEDMISSDGQSIHNIYNGKVTVYAVNYGNISNGAFTIEYNGLPKSAVIFFGSSDSNVSNNAMMSIKIN